MGVDVRWFNHDSREFIDPGDLPAHNRWGYTDPHSATAFYAYVRDAWNNQRIEMISDTQDDFGDLPRAGYKDVTKQAAEHARKVVELWGAPYP